MYSDQQVKNRLRDEFNDIENKHMWNTTYRFVEAESSKIRKTSDEAKKPQNKSFNRYQDVSPYDDTIISLKKGDVSYINANLIQVCDCDRQYILTQGPLENTSSHFWLMVWEQNSKVIIMLNKVIEKKKLKCHQYWPRKKRENYKFIWNNIGLSVEFLSKINHGFYVQSILKLNDLESGNSREIFHFHYTDWPDFGVPKTPTPFLRFLRDIRRSGSLDLSNGPAIVHCSAGIGRSGTFCLIDLCLIQMNTPDGLKYVHVRSLLVEMRKCRMGLVQAPEQLRFCYQSIIEALDTNWEAENEDDLPNLDGALLNNDNESEDDSTDSELSSEAPPRTESLKKTNKHQYVEDDEDDDKGDDDDDESLVSESESDDTESTPPPLPPPREIDQPKINEHNKSINTKEHKKLKLDEEVEKTKALADTLKLMKRKQKDQEKWEQIKRSWLNPLRNLGLGVLALSGGVMIIAYYINYKK